MLGIRPISKGKNFDKGSLQSTFIHRAHASNSATSSTQPLGQRQTNVPRENTYIKGQQACLLSIER
jgi:hypothetical protein